MRVSALRIVHEPPPPPPWNWDGFEDVRETAQRSTLLKELGYG